jgi:hypothetical protein
MRKIYNLIPAIMLVALGFLFFSHQARSAVSEQKDYWPDGKIREYRRYDSQGDLIDKTYYRKDGTPQQHETYDSDGHLVEESYYDENGNLAKNPTDDWAAMRWIYKDGILREDITYGINGRIKERREYNSIGDLVDRQYIGNEEPDPEEEFSPPLCLKGRTDEFLDSSGKPTYATSAYQGIFGLWGIED